MSAPTQIATHTPGPWTWDGKFTVEIPHAKGLTAFRTNPEDACLIAAVPDLLEAARFARSVILANGAIVSELSEQIAVEKLDAAIAKAEGQR